MPALSINVNKIATLRNSRGGDRPAVVPFARAAIDAGADGITVHPRPDERHIRRGDVMDLREMLAACPGGGRHIEFNIEGYPDARYRELVRLVRPDQATLVPDPPDVLTSNAGWRAAEHRDFLRDAVAELAESAGRVSLFMETDLREIDAAAETGAHRIELYTESFARAFAQGHGRESFAEFSRAATHATGLGLGINAGHDLDLENLVLFRDLPGLLEVSIGHAVVCDALLAGWDTTIRRYKAVCAAARQGAPT